MFVERAALVCTWLATYFLHSTLLLGAAWVATRKMGPRLDPLAEQIWRSALALPVVTSLAQQWIALATPLTAAPVGAIGYTPMPLAASMVPDLVWIGGAMIWLIGALLGVGRLFVLRRLLRQRIRGRHPLPLHHERRVSSLLAPDRIRVSLVVDLAIPFAMVDEICLPVWLVDRMTVAELRAVIAHEVAHVRRRDAFWRPAISALASGFFFQPLNWVAVGKLRELSECICDADAVAATRSPVPLAIALETVATRAVRDRTRVVLSPAMGAPVSLTMKRVGRILSDSSPRPMRCGKPGVARRATALVAVALVAILFAPRVSLPGTTFMRYTINAEDPAGPFTVTVERGRVVAATIGGRQLEPRRVRQKGASLELVDDNARVLSLQMTPGGGIKWNARSFVSHRM